MKSQRTKRSRSTAKADGSKQPPREDSDDKPVASQRAIHPPKRNITMLSISIVLFVVWVAFLVYVALFG